MTDAGISFCSTGCRDVYRALPDHTPRDEGDSDGRTTRADDHDHGTEGGERDVPEDAMVRTFFQIDGMYSATCEAFLESVAESKDGVVEADASYVTETIRVRHDPDRISESELRDALSRLGYSAYLRNRGTDTDRTSDRDASRSEPSPEVRKRRDEQILEFRYAVGILFGAFLMLPYVAILYPAHLATFVDSEILRLFEGAFQLDSQGGLAFLRFYFVMTGVILVFTGLPVLRGAYVSLKMRRPNTDLLVATTAASAYVYSTLAVLVGRNDIFYDLTLVVAASVTAAVFYESTIKQRALGRLTDLTVSQVDSARVYDSDGTTRDVPIEDLTPDDRVLVRQGERIPVDGVLDEGECTVDEAVVTGESLPVPKTEGDDVLGGSVVTTDAAVVRVGDGTTSSVDRITDAVWEIQSTDHGVHRRADRLASRAIGIVVGAAVLVGLGGFAFGVGSSRSVLLFLGVLLVGSPWALGLATQLSVASSLREALDRGIVVFDETVFERLRDIDVVVFDKTGTLTTGNMEVIEADVSPGLLEAVAELERRASHPTADAIVSAFDQSIAETDESRADGGVSPESDPKNDSQDRVREFTTHTSGIEGVVDGNSVLVGNLRLFEERQWTVTDDLEMRAIEIRRQGRLPVIVGRDGTAEGIIVVGDEPREGWADTITSFGSRGADVVVLTGDAEEATEFFEGHEHLTHVFADVPPEGKTATIRRLKSTGSVAMVGDGTNDAPALAEADLGISMGSGTALAADAADITIADDAIESVETAFDLAHAAKRRVGQNNGLALVYNAIAIPAAIVGMFNPLTAMVAVAAGGGLIVTNCSRSLVNSRDEGNED